VETSVFESLKAKLIFHQKKLEIVLTQEEAKALLILLASDQGAEL